MAAAAVADLRDRVAAVERQAEGDPSRSITSLLIFEGTIFPNASRSMGHAQLEVLGLDNVFGDVDEAFFEASVEELIAQDPDVVVLGYGFLEGDTVKTLDRAKAEFLALPGVTGTSAVRNDDIVGLLAREDEPGVAAVDGLESLTAALAGPD